MMLTRFQKVVIAAAASLIVVRLFAPVRYIPGTDAISCIPGVWSGRLFEGMRVLGVFWISGVQIGGPGYETRILTSATIFHVVGIAVLAAALCFLMPTLPPPTASPLTSGTTTIASPRFRNLPWRVIVIATLVVLYVLGMAAPPAIAPIFLVPFALLLAWLVLFTVVLSVRAAALSVWASLHQDRSRHTDDVMMALRGPERKGPKHG